MGIKQRVLSLQEITFTFFMLDKKSYFKSLATKTISSRCKEEEKLQAYKVATALFNFFFF